MKYRHYLRIDEKQLAPTAFEEICKIAPDGRKSYGFDLMVDSESPDGGQVVCKITSICRANGLTRRRAISDTSYGHSADRWYGEERLRVEFLVLYRQHQMQQAAKPERDEKGRLLLSAEPKWKFGSVFPNHILVSEKVRRILESAAFIGLQFGEVTVKSGSFNASPIQFWELQSSVALPKMVNTHQFVHLGLREAEPFQGDYYKIIMLDDPPFNKGEVHYRRKDLKEAGLFDIARTFENYMEPHPALVISQRFYQHCLKNGIKLEADPVRIDPD
jgi:hypothetical protein